jgi:ferredoxin-type protein NapH
MDTSYGTDPTSPPISHPNRQRVRTAVGLVSIAFFPVSLYYLSPYVPLVGLTAEIISGAFVVFAVLFVAAGFSGRFFCGWVCPVGAFEDLLFRGSGPPRFRTRSLAIARLAIFALWVGGIAIVVARSGIPRRVEFGFMTTRGVSVVDLGGAIVLVSVLSLFALLTAIFGRRGGCRSICWIAPFMQAGFTIGRWLHVPGIEIRYHAHAPCGTCTICNDVCPMALSPRRIAAAEAKGNPLYETTECILCARCVDHCPKSNLSMHVPGWRKR